MTATTGSTPDDSRPKPGQRYQIPAELAGTAAGTIVTYGNAKYLIGNDGTMTALSDQTAQR